MPRRTSKAKKDITVQPSECEEFVLVPVRLLKSLRGEIDSLREALRLPARAWESPATINAVVPVDPISRGGATRASSSSSSSSELAAAVPHPPSKKDEDSADVG